MTKFIIMSIYALVLPFAAWADGATIKVNGMVCAFCSSSIEKKFKEKSEVKAIDVNLDTKLVTIEYHPGKSLPEKEIKDIVTKSGYTVVSVTQTAAASEEKAKQ